MNIFTSFAQNKSLHTDRTRFGRPVHIGEVARLVLTTKATDGFQHWLAIADKRHGLEHSHALEQVEYFSDILEALGVSDRAAA